MVRPEDITIDEKNGRYYIILHSEEIEFRSNDLELSKAISIRDRMIKSADRHGIPTITHLSSVPPELREFFS